MYLVVETQCKLYWPKDPMNLLDVDTPWINLTLTAEATELCMHVCISAHVVTGSISCQWYTELVQPRKSRAATLETDRAASTITQGDRRSQMNVSDL